MTPDHVLAHIRHACAGAKELMRYDVAIFPAPNLPAPFGGRTLASESMAACIGR